jgi:GNT-I family
MSDPSAPIAVFAFNRPKHLRDTLRSLMACEDSGKSPIIVFCDGPRSDLDRELIEATLDVARAELGSSADIRPTVQNMGIFRSITGGVNQILEKYERIIVIEDDLELARSFLKFVNGALTAYADDARVFQVAGYSYDVPEFRSRETAVLQPFTSSIGWGTWKRAWRAFDSQASAWQKISFDRHLRKRFNLGGSYDYTSAVRRQMTDDPKHWDWDARWYLSVFNENGLVVFPPRSLVRHTGFDGSGTHGSALFRNYPNQSVENVVGPNSFITPATDPPESDLSAVRAALWRHNGGWLGWSVDRCKRLLRI